MQIDPTVSQGPITGTRPTVVAREQRIRPQAPGDRFTATGSVQETPPAVKASDTERAETAGNATAHEVTTSLTPSPANATLKSVRPPTISWNWTAEGNPFFDGDAGTLANSVGGLRDVAFHEVGHGLPDATPRLMGGFAGGMLGSLLGAYTDPAEFNAALEMMQRAGQAMHRLQSLEGGYTAEHMARAGDLATKLGDALEGTPRQLSTDQRFALAHAAMIYDVGKLEVDEALLLKPGKLEPEERQAVNKHVEPSEELLSNFNPNPETRGIIRHHHERWDGGGFPDRLKGEQIPLTARLVAIADSWDAMTCDRPFRPAMAYEKARGIIEGGAGTQYDPALVKTFFDKVATGPA